MDKKESTFWPIRVEDSGLTSFRYCAFQETDYIMSYFDNGEGFEGDSDHSMDEATYWKPILDSGLFIPPVSGDFRVAEGVCTCVCFSVWALTEFPYWF